MMNNDYDMDYPSLSMCGFIRSRLSDKRSGLAALEYFSRRFTYKWLFAEVDRCSAALRSVGIGKGDRVAICSPNVPQAVVCFYAVNMIGAVSVMIHPLSGANEMKHYLQKTKSRMLFAIDLAAERLRAILPETSVERTVYLSAADYMPFPMKAAYLLTNKHSSDWFAFVRSGKKANPVDAQSESVENDVASILFSGGTTGKPKGVELTNLNFNALALQSVAACACLSENDRILAAMPIFHGFGLGICIHTVLSFGGTAILIPRFSSKTFGKLITKYKPNVIAGVPTLFRAMLNSGDETAKLSFLKCVISGGDTLPESLRAEVDAYLKKCGSGARIRQGYGLTECVTGSCMMPENCDRDGIGIPYPGILYKVVSPGTTDEISDGETGELVLCGATVMKGYLDEPEETSATLRMHPDGRLWLHTGDLGSRDPDGFLHFAERRKRMIVTSGYNVYPQLLEDIALTMDGISQAAAIGAPDEYKGAVPVLYVTGTASVKTLRELLAAELPAYAVPKRVIVLEAMPVTLVGKIDYKKLAELLTRPDDSIETGAKS